jgi:hypothetical protein
MHLTRTGYNALIAIWLLPMVLMDLWGNTVEVGSASDYFYYKMMADGLLITYALFQIFGRPNTATQTVAQNRKNDHKDDVVGFESLGAGEYIYCGLLVIYAAVCWYGLHSINKNSTGIEATLSAIWSFVSIAVAVLSAIQFWHLKSGAIVELKSKVVQ